MIQQSHSWAYISRQNSNPKKYMHPYVPSSTIHTNQDMETDGWIKMWFIYDAMGILLNHKKEQQKIKQNKIVPFAATQMDLEIIILSKSEKDQYHMISHMWNLKYDTNELIEKQTLRHREQTCDCRAGRRLRDGGGWC